MKHRERIQKGLEWWKSNIVAVIGVVFVLLVLLQASGVIVFPSSTTFSINGTEIRIEIARTPEERNQGLSGRTILPEKNGMLFIFDTPSRYGFWMPDMHFAIDIVWIGADGRIVDISPNVTPESYPNSFMPAVPAQFVLEVPAGSASKFNWKVGDLVHTPYIEGVQVTP